MPHDDEPWKNSEEQVRYLPLQAREGDLAIFLVSGATEIIYSGDKYFIVLNAGAGRRFMIKEML